MGNIHYDVVQKRWVIEGADERPRMYIPDANNILSQINFAVGSTPAVGVATAAIGLATISVAGLAVGDKVFVNPKSLMTLAFAGTHIPAADTLNILLANPVLAVGTQPALGWDILRIKSE